PRPCRGALTCAVAAAGAATRCRRRDAASCPPVSAAEGAGEFEAPARMAAAGTGLAAGAHDPPRQGALDGVRAPGVVGVDIHHADIRPGRVRPALAAADAGLVPAVRAAVHAVPGGAAAQGAPV